MLSSSINFSGSFDTYTDVFLATKYCYPGAIPPFMKLALDTFLVAVLPLTVQATYSSCPSSSPQKYGGVLFLRSKSGPQQSINYIQTQQSNHNTF